MAFYKMLKNNTDYPAIVISAYNRPKSLLRVLRSLEKGIYPQNVSVPLIISIDGGGSHELVQIAEDYDWIFGNKIIIAHKENLGLKNHIISCGDLTADYGSIILLEDDLVVSKSFYQYAYKAAEFYSKDEAIAQISLYSYTMSEHTLGQFLPIKNEQDVYFMKWPSSWGQLWLKDQWKNFKDWLENNGNWDALKKIVPSKVSNWPNSSWKKFFLAYLCINDRYVVYPYSSFTSLYGDSGQNHRAGTLPQFKSPLALDFKEYKFVSSYKSSLFYDEYFQPTKVLIDSMTDEFHNFEYEVDFEGIKALKNISSEYLISIRPCKEPIDSFGWELSPVEMNLGNNKGDMIYFGKTSSFVEKLSLSHWVCYSYRYSQLLNAFRELKRAVLKIIFKLIRKI